MDSYDYVIVGAGVNGTSIATSLASHGFRVAVLDRSSDGFVAPDGASHDLNKIVRADYTDANFCTLAKEAIARWRSSPVLSRFYHEVGVLFRSSATGDVWGKEGSAEEYVHNGIKHAALESDMHLEVFPAEEKVRAFKLNNDAQVEEILGKAEGLKGDGLKGMGRVQTGYFNPRAGWAEANNATRALLAHAVKLGVTVYPHSSVASFLYEADEVVGVKTADGRVVRGDNVVLAAGAWTQKLLTTLLPGVGEAWMTRPSAQCVAVVRLTRAEALQLKATPVVINFATGFYQFEPTPTADDDEWHLKIAIHSNGFLHPSPPSTFTGTFPAFSCTDSTEQDAFGMAACSMPENQLEIMLEELRQTWPHLAQRERVVCTRVCWYSDTLDENWIIDSLANHPARPKGTDKVWVVSGDSGHAFKFLPIIGDVFLAAKRLVPNTRQLDLSRFTFNHHARTHADKNAGRAVQSADSNRAHSTPLANARARL